MDMHKCNIHINWDRITNLLWPSEQGLDFLGNWKQECAESYEAWLSPCPMLLLTLDLDTVVLTDARGFGFSICNGNVMENIN